MVTLDTVTRSRREVLRVLFRVGHTSKWYSRQGSENIGTVIEGSLSFGDGELSRVWWTGSVLRLNCKGCAFSDLIATDVGDLVVHIATNEDNVSELSLKPNQSVGGGYINLNFPPQIFTPLDAVSNGDLINLVIGDIVK